MYRLPIFPKGTDRHLPKTCVQQLGATKRGDQALAFKECRSNLIHATESARGDASSRPVAIGLAHGVDRQGASWGSVHIDPDSRFPVALTDPVRANAWPRHKAKARNNAPTAAALLSSWTGIGTLAPT